MAWAGNRFEPAKEVRSPPRETIEIWKLERIDPLRIIVYLFLSAFPSPSPSFFPFFPLPSFLYSFRNSVEYSSRP